ncbi:MAG: hypothetical protein KKI02_08580 [Planctomycetes bacterium]|nr:hypothetical protein [Planctomycetota bacterium]
MNARLLYLMVAGMIYFGAADLAAGDDVTAKNPLNPPLFSIDALSPEVLDGPLQPGDLLLPGGPDFPDVVIPAEGMFLLDAGDDLDAFSFGPWEGCETTEFVLIFSVDRGAVGVAPPDPVLVSMGFPFNVLDQAVNNQAAGDAFMSLLLFTRMGPIPPPGRPSHSENNTLVVNQGDAGGVHFQLSPQEESPTEPQDPGTPQSDADAGSGTQPAAANLGERGGPAPILFSLTSESPSLQALPGTGSGADIYIDWDPYVPGEGEALYVSPFELGLQGGDDIDAMIVIDVLDDGYFTHGVDQIIFSLAPGSPSLDGSFGPGDLFTSSGNGIFAPYCYADQLGLAPTDNLNLLDYVFCDDVLPCVEEWAIGYVYQCIGDLDGDGDVDLADLAILLSSYGRCEGDPGFVPEADIDGNGCVELADLATLLAHYGEICW